MSWDSNALIKMLQESMRSVDLSTVEIQVLRSQKAELEEKVIRLETQVDQLQKRLAAYGQRMRRMEEGEL